MTFPWTAGNPIPPTEDATTNAVPVLYLFNQVVAPILASQTARRPILRDNPLFLRFPRFVCF